MPESKKRGLDSKSAAMVAVNILSALFLTLLAFVFFAYGYGEKALKFIGENYILLFWLTFGLLFAVYGLYVVFYALGKQTVHRLLFCTLVCLDIIAVLFYILSATGILSRLTSIEELRKYISSFGALAVIIFIVFQFLQVIILPVPGSVSVGVGVALFGPLKCSIFSFIGILLGSLAAFFIGRVIGYKAVCWIVGEKDLQKWLDKVKGKDYLLLSIMFLLPLFPDDILCFVAGLSSMTTKFFVIMITVTRAISILATAYSLQLIPFTTWWGILIWLLLAAAVGVGFWLVCKYSSVIDSFLKGKLKGKKQSGGKSRQ